MSLRNDIMRFSVLGFRSDIRIELQAPVVKAPSPKEIKEGPHIKSLLFLQLLKQYILIKPLPP